MRRYLAFLIVLFASTGNSNCQEPVAAEKTIAAKDFYRKALEDFSNSPPEKQYASIEELAAWQKSGEVILIDFRDEREFKREHIAGAINLPAGEITAETLTKVIPSKDSRVVVYCQQNIFPSRMIALTTLGYPTIKQHGYTNVQILEEFWNEPGCGSSRRFLEDPTAKCPIELVTATPVPN